MYGVIGSGSFGTAVANLMAENGKVLIHTRREEVFDNFAVKRMNKNQPIHPNITPTRSLQEVCEKCQVIFPVVPSASFRKAMRDAAPYLTPAHILIHGTKGLNVRLPNNASLRPGQSVRRTYIRTMTDIMSEETVVLRMGCLSGPNLARELAAKQPAATVIASKFDEVINIGRDALKSSRFRVYSSYDLEGVELAGVLKNIMAIASGMLAGLGYGENSRAMLITRGLGEMIKIGRALGAETQAFFGIAGIGDLIATCSSNLSRNFTVGNRMAQGKTLSEVMETMEEVAEGVNTIKLVKGVSQFYNLDTPIADTLYNCLYNDKPITDGLGVLMRDEHSVDADYLE